MAFVGISNENDFYSPFYLDSILSQDLKFWREKRPGEKEGGQGPEGLYKINKLYFNLRDKWSRSQKPEERFYWQQRLLQAIFESLGYRWQPQLKVLDDGTVLPIVVEVTKGNGLPFLWAIAGFNQTGEPTSVLSLSLIPEQYEGLKMDMEMDPDLDMELDASVGSEITTVINKENKQSSKQKRVKEEELEKLLSNPIFAQVDAPRWVILASIEEIVLIERYKWNASRLLKFDLSKILEEKDTSSLLVTNTLLHKNSIYNENDNLCLLDTLDDNSHKHSCGVSKELKYALREAIELLGNEAIYYWQKNKGKIYSTKAERERGEQRIDPQELKIQCLRWVYRLLFVFYIEARPEMGYIPMGSDVYRLGYSLETLRDLENIPLTSPEDENSFYLDCSIRHLFNLL